MKRDSGAFVSWAQVRVALLAAISVARVIKGKRFMPRRYILPNDRGQAQPPGTGVNDRKNV
jgi:hypothetical protein